MLAINTYLEHQLWKKAKYDKFIDERGIKVLDALSATGLRSVRYAKELKSNLPLKIVANDLSRQAVETIKKNVAHNGIEQIVSVENQDAA